MRAAGGCVFAVTSEPQRLADQARVNWRLSFPVYGDPTHTLGRHLISKNLVPGLIIMDQQQLAQEPARTQRWYANHPFMKKYNDGCAQPAIAVLQQGSGGQPFVAFSAAVHPNANNGFGAADRPNPRQLWTAFKNTAAGTRIDGSSFRKAHITDEAYICVAIGQTVALALLLLAWLGGLVADSGAKQWLAVVFMAAAFAWYWMLAPTAAATLAPAPAIEGEPKPVEPTELEPKQPASENAEEC